jgi:hypothetical protein
VRVLPIIVHHKYVAYVRPNSSNNISLNRCRWSVKYIHSQWFLTLLHVILIVRFSIIYYWIMKNSDHILIQNTMLIIAKRISETDIIQMLECHFIGSTCLVILFSTCLPEVQHTCLRFNIPVWGSTYLSEVQHTCLRFNIPVWGSTYMSKVQHTCLRFNIPV